MKLPFLLATIAACSSKLFFASAECNQCQFDGNDEASCKVYGQLGDDELIGWALASQECLDAHNIKKQAVDPLMLSSMFPNADGSDANVNAFVSFLKNTNGAAVNAILLSMDDFFVETTPGQRPTFKDTITVDGTSYDCQTSTSDCWNALKIYFATPEGAEVLVSSGQILYDKARNDRELEQSTVRIAICNDHEEDGKFGPSFSCSTLATQVLDVKEQNPDKACSAFGLGPAENAIPGCEGANSASRGASSTSHAATGFPTVVSSWYFVPRSVVVTVSALFLFIM